MSKRSKSHQSGAFGFTLIELMVVVAIVGTLVAIAIPSYNQSIRKSRRTEAKAALLDLAGREERYYNTNGNQYTAVASNLGYNAPGATINPVGNGYYSVTLNAPVPAAGAPWTYVISAVPVTTDQLKDAACLYFQIDNTGLQKAGTGPGAAAVPQSPCWQ